MNSNYPTGRVLAIIVTYNPGHEIEGNLARLYKQVDGILVVDNSTQKRSRLRVQEFKKKFKFVLIENEDNVGVAGALNQGVRFALENGYEWVITLDQDSTLSENYVEEIFAVHQQLKESDRVAILAPVHFDRKTGYRSRQYSEVSEPFEFRDIVMTSGNVLPAWIFEEVGLYDENLFIEYVDHEFCLRLKTRGFRAVVVPRAQLGHSLGDIRKHHLGPWFFFSHNYLPVRRYYRARNRIALYKKYFGWWILHDQEFAIKDMIKIFLVEANRRKKVMATVEGTFHAFMDFYGSYENAKRQELSLSPESSTQSSVGALASSGTAEKSSSVAQFSDVLKNSGYNFLGHILPLAIGFICIRFLVQNIGIEKFGLLTVVWALIGYFSLFDFGLSRIITVKVSELMAQKRDQEVNVTFWTSMKIILIATLFGSFLLFGFSFFRDFVATKTTPEIVDDVLASLRVIAVTLPAITLTAGLKGALEADQQFFKLNLIQSFLGVSNFLIPTLISFFDSKLASIVFTLSIVRYLFMLVHFWVLRKTSNWLKPYQVQKISESWPLIVSGGWVSITNIVSPIMVYFDRFFLALLIPSSQLAFYTTPFEIVNRLLIIPSSITRAIFPVLASRKEYRRSRLYFNISFQLILVISLIVFVGGALVGHWGLGFWLGTEFAKHSFSILLVLLLGFLMNSLAWTAFTFIQAVQRPDLTAKAHLIELPIYCLALYFFTIEWGLIGAAWAWTLRNTIDLFILSGISARLFAEIKKI